MKKLLTLLFFTVAITSVCPQGLDLGWSLGELGWSHGFADDSNGFTSSLVNIYLSFEAINLTLKTSVISTDWSGDAPTAYSSYFPVELIFTPVKFKYANLELYAKGAWETKHDLGIFDAAELSSGLFGSAGLRLGFLPAEGEVFGYHGYMFNVFAEYTSRNEFNAGINIDILNIVIPAGALIFVASSVHGTDQ